MGGPIRRSFAVVDVCVCVVGRKHNESKSIARVRHAKKKGSESSYTPRTQWSDCWETKTQQERKGVGGDNLTTNRYDGYIPPSFFSFCFCLFFCVCFSSDFYSTLVCYSDGQPCCQLSIALLLWRRRRLSFHSSLVHAVERRYRESFTLCFCFISCPSSTNTRIQLCLISRSKRDNGSWAAHAMHQTQ